MNERLRLACLAGDEARRYLDWLRAVKENPQDEQAWNMMTTVVPDLAGALSEFTNHLDDEKQEGIKAMSEPTINARVQYTAGQAYLAHRTGVVKAIDKSLGNLWKLTIVLDKPLMVNDFGTMKAHTEWCALWSTLPGVSSVRIVEE